MRAGNNGSVMESSGRPTYLKRLSLLLRNYESDEQIAPKGRGEQIKIDLLTGKKRNSTAWTEWDRSIARGGDG
ncbi:hypothetical protein Tco_1271944 [Tanacetum coccineum]